jgi:hypothetical protein
MLSYDLWYMIIQHTSPEIRRYLMHTCQITRHIILDRNLTLSITLQCGCLKKCFKTFVPSQIYAPKIFSKCCCCHNNICNAHPSLSFYGWCSKCFTERVIVCGISNEINF